MTRHVFVCCVLHIVLIAIIQIVDGFPDQGKWDVYMNLEQEAISVPKSLLSGSKIYVQITCDSHNRNTQVKISWLLAQSFCWDYENHLPKINTSHQIKSEPFMAQCSDGGHIILPEMRIREEIPVQKKAEIGFKKRSTDINTKNLDNPIFIITQDGVYIFRLEMNSDQFFNASIHLEIIGPNGYMSAADWPLLPFYGAMCIVYVIFGTVWLMVTFMQWRDLLRIQFWIGGVILLGMLEKAMFYGEYQSINSNGSSVKGAVLLAEWVSCAKRTLARMLVVIVSLGFGIVKPRLGPMLHRVVGTGALYFILACVESYLRVMHKKNDNQLLVASIPLAVLDSAICWWIFNSLVQTTRTLRLRRNMVKLSLYRHFTNTLIFSVIASVIFMLYSIKAHRLVDCLIDWQELWVDEAFWHVLFSALLLVIMILWRPTNNNQRYAFTPLLDNPEDDDDDEEEQFVSDAFGVKMRHGRNISPRSSSRLATTTEDDDLRWVEEHIPAAIADASLPVFDSEEEILNTKFEVSKMQ